jgi:AcrR family transcriptional regulator
MPTPVISRAVISRAVVAASYNRTVPDPAPQPALSQGAARSLVEGPRSELATAVGRRGRRRDPTIATRVAHTVIAVYAQLGWAGLTFDEVARRARVGKAALYLRWSSKEELLLDSMASIHVRHLAHAHDDLRRDLAEIAHSLLAFYASTNGLAYLRLYVESRYVPGLEERWRRQQTTPLFLETRALVREATSRGELPEGTSPTIVLDALAGAIANHVLSTPPELFSQMVENGPSYVESLVDFVLAGARSVRPAPPS